MVKKREAWIDNIKVIACFLVVLGHFFQSMTKADILPENDLYLWFNQTIYYFHVPLFFICSGYLYQKYTRIESFAMWKENILKKLFLLGIPYFTFSGITWLMKTLFAGAVNEKIGSPMYILFVSPVPPYWYLYCLFFLFIVTPTFRNKTMAVGVLLVAVVLKVFSIMGYTTNSYIISSVMANGIWLVMGMYLSILERRNVTGYKKRSLGIIGAVSGVVFLGLSIWFYRHKIDFPGMNIFLGIISCASIISIAYSFFYGEEQNKIFEFGAKYTMPIFLMHTIFAAFVRSVLLRFGVKSPMWHMFFGIGISFGGPIVVAKIMAHFKWLDFFLFPGKYIYHNPHNKESSIESNS